MRNENFIILPGWAINHLNLKPAQLIVFGYIYGYTQNGKQWYEGSYDDIAGELNLMTRRNVINIVDQLIELEYIEKKHSKTGNKYRVNLSKIFALFTSEKISLQNSLGSEKISLQVVKKFHSDYLSNINNNLLGDFLKSNYKFTGKKNQSKLSQKEMRFLEIIFNEIWIDQTLKRHLLNENLYKDFQKEVIPVMFNFAKNKLASGDIHGNAPRIQTALSGYLRAVLKNKINKQDDDNSSPNLPVL